MSDTADIRLPQSDFWEKVVQLYVDGKPVLVSRLVEENVQIHHPDILEDILKEKGISPRKRWSSITNREIPVPDGDRYILAGAGTVQKIRAGYYVFEGSSEHYPDRPIDEEHLKTIKSMIEGLDFLILD